MLFSQGLGSLSDNDEGAYSRGDGRRENTSGGTPVRRGSMNRTYGEFPPPRNHFEEVYFKDITIERGRRPADRGDPQDRNANVQINGKFVS